MTHMASNSKKETEKELIDFCFFHQLPLMVVDEMLITNTNQLEEFVFMVEDYKIK